MPVIKILLLFFFYFNHSPSILFCPSLVLLIVGKSETILKPAAHRSYHVTDTELKSHVSYIPGMPTSFILIQCFILIQLFIPAALTTCLFFLLD